MKARTKVILIGLIISFILGVILTSFILNNEVFHDYNLLDKSTCESKGGSYFIGGEYFVCQMPVNDEGLSCSDSSQCEDICKAETKIDTTGICTVFSHGCDLVLNDGKASWLCS